MANAYSLLIACRKESVRSRPPVMRNWRIRQPKRYFPSLTIELSKIVVGCGYRHSFYLQAVALSGALNSRGVFESLFRKDLTTE